MIRYYAFNPFTGTASTPDPGLLVELATSATLLTALSAGAASPPADRARPYRVPAGDHALRRLMVIPRTAQPGSIPA